MNHKRIRLTGSIFCAVVLLAGLTIPCRAQLPELINDSEFRPVARQAVDSLYNLNPEASGQLLQPWKERYPSHPLWILFEGMELWWKILSDLENTSHDERFFNLMGRADYESTRLLREKGTHADALIIKAISNGYIARQLANRDRWVASMNQARKAYNAYQYLLELQPGMPDLMLAEGLKLYYAEYLPEAYPIVKTVSWFLPDGDKRQGLRMLERAAERSIFAQAEARYFLGNILLQYEKDYPEAARHLGQLYRTYPNNSYYVRILVRSYYRMNKYDRAVEIIDTALARWNERQLPYETVLKEDLLTWRGRIRFSQFRFREAIPDLKAAYEAGLKLDNPDLRSLHVISGYYLAQCYLKTGNRPKAEHYFREVTRMETKTGYREQARAYLDEEF